MEGINKKREFVTKKEKMENTSFLVDNYEKIPGRYYHGSSFDFDNILPSDESGNIRNGEEDRRSFRDLVFLTDDFDLAKKYAGEEGIIYIVDANAVKYKDIAVDVLDKKKQKTVGDNIFVAKSEEINIISKWIKDKRNKNEKQKYFDTYIGQNKDIDFNQ